MSARPDAILCRLWREDRGSAPAEFAMVSVLLVFLVLGVVQFALAVFVRNTALDAAAEGARQAALADSTLDAGAERTRELISTTLGAEYATDVRASYADWNGSRVAQVTVRAPLPVIGLLGPEGSMEVAGHAALETIG
ncbi:MAG: pilus assembly protein [Micrococcales bacterium]|nr:pilus assembly protein [Micrococcales bacterium]